MKDVSDAITRFIQLEDVFKGKAGDSIRDFYATCHIPFIQFVRLFLRDYESALKSIKDSLIDLEPSVDGFIDTGFVVSDVHMGLNKVSGVAETLTASVNDTLRSIQDIVDVKLIDDTELQSSVHRARNEANMVVERVLEFDYRSTATLRGVKGKLGIALRYLSEISGAFDSGKLSISHFDIGKLNSLPAYKEMTAVVDKEIGMAVKERLSKYFKLMYANVIGFNPRYFISAGLNFIRGKYFVSNKVDGFNPSYFASADADVIHPFARLNVDVKAKYVVGGVKKVIHPFATPNVDVKEKYVKDAKNFIESNLEFFQKSTTVVWDGTKWTYDKAMTPIGRTFDWWDNTVVSHIEDFALLIAVEEFLSEHATDGARTGGSIGLDLFPVSSNVKGVFETLMGYDPVTGNDLGHGERLISGFSVALGPIADSFKHGGRGIRGIFNNGDKLKSVSKVSNVGKSKWWHLGYVNNLSSNQILLGVTSSSKGLSTLGSTTRSNAFIAGKAWVGNGAKPIYSGGKLIGYRSKDGMRAFRLQYKNNEQMWRANFTENVIGEVTGKKSQIKNVHLDILD
jgi:hypothetical protein